VRYRVLGLEESGFRIQESGFRIRDSGVKILVYLMRLGNAIITQKLLKQFLEEEIERTIKRLKKFSDEAYLLLI
jgi:hypothetical protein